MGITVITGNGKGKTTGALGLALLALGRGQRAAMVQFLKGNSYTGELFSAQRAGLKVYQFGWSCPWSSLIRNGTMQCSSCGSCFRENRKPEHGFGEKALALAAELANSGQYDLLILDEISHAFRRGLLDKQQLLELVRSCRERMDFVLTGRHMAEEIIALADEAYELQEVKHPFAGGTKSRRGIEY